MSMPPSSIRFSSRATRAQPPLEQTRVDRLKRAVALERELEPEVRDLAVMSGRLERAVGPAEPPGHQLLAGDPHRAEAGAAGVLRELPGGERVLVHHVL